MKKIVALALLAVVVLPMTILPAFAQETKEIAVIDVGNKICPLMNGKVDGKTFVVYEGKRYSFCCPGCEIEFMKDPAKYIAKIKAAEPDLKTI